MAELTTPAALPLTRPDAVATGPAIPPEELAVLKHRLATIDHALPLDEFMARVDQAVTARGAEPLSDKS